MDIIAIPAHIDNNEIALDAPFDLKPSMKLAVVIIPDNQTINDRSFW